MIDRSEVLKKNLVTGKNCRMIICGFNFREGNMRGQLKTSYALAMLPGRRMLLALPHGLLIPSRKFAAELIRRGRALNIRRKAQGLKVGMCKIDGPMQFHKVNEDGGTPVLMRLVQNLQLQITLLANHWRRLTQPDAKQEDIDLVNTETIKHCAPCPERGNCLQGNLFGRKITV